MYFTGTVVQSYNSWLDTYDRRFIYMWIKLDHSFINEEIYQYFVFLLRWLNRVMQDHEARAGHLKWKLIFSFFLLFS